MTTLGVCKYVRMWASHRFAWESPWLQCWQRNTKFEHIPQLLKYSSGVCTCARGKTRYTWVSNRIQKFSTIDSALTECTNKTLHHFHYCRNDLRHLAKVITHSGRICSHTLQGTRLPIEKLLFDRAQDTQDTQLFQKRLTNTCCAAVPITHRENRFAFTGNSLYSSWYTAQCEARWR